MEPTGPPLRSVRQGDVSPRISAVHYLRSSGPARHGGTLTRGVSTAKLSIALLRSLEKKLAGPAVIAHQPSSYMKGKNSSDIALVIDALDLMHTGRSDGCGGAR